MIRGGFSALVDDLNAPLGQDKQRRLANLPVSAPQLLAGALGLSGVVVVAWAAFVNDPLGGEPIALVATKVSATSISARDSDKDGKQHSRHDGAASSPPDAPAAAAKPDEMPPPGSRTVTIIDGSSGARKLVAIPGNPDAATKALFDPKLVEATRHGAIPKIGLMVRVHPAGMRSPASCRPTRKIRR